MKILFVTHPYPNYVPDLLLHGLRKLMGPDVVDYPRKDCLYQGVLGLGVCPEDQRCPGWFPQDNDTIDREDIWEKLNKSYFEYIVCDYRALAMLLEHLAAWPSGLIVLDGEDAPAPIPPGKYIICRRETDGSDFSVPLPMALPEEILHWITRYDDVPKKYSLGFLGSTQDGARKKIVETIARSYPDTLFQTSLVPETSNPSPEGRLGRDEYYHHLQKCRMVLSLSGAGHDTFRFWENAACNAIHLCYRFPLYIPNDFIAGVHLLRFSDMSELKRAVDRTLEGGDRNDEIIQNGRYHLVTFHLTTKRAEYFLDRVKQALAR